MATDPTSPSQSPDPQGNRGDDFAAFVRGQRPTVMPRRISHGGQMRVIGGALAGAALSVVLAYFIYRHYFADSLAHNPYAQTVHAASAPRTSQIVTTAEPSASKSGSRVLASSSAPTDSPPRPMPNNRPAVASNGTALHASDLPVSPSVKNDSSSPRPVVTPTNPPGPRAPQASRSYPLLVATDKPPVDAAPVELSGAVRNPGFEITSGSKAEDWTFGSGAVSVVRLPLKPVGLVPHGNGQSALLMRSLLMNGVSREAVAFQKLTTALAAGTYTLTVDAAAARPNAGADYRIAICDGSNNKPITSAGGKVDPDGKWHSLSVTCVVPPGAAYLKHPVMVRLSHSGTGDIVFDNVALVGPRSGPTRPVPVAHWDFDQIGALAEKGVRTKGAISSVPGVRGRALALNDAAENCWVDLPDDPSIHFTTSMTVCAWFKARAGTGYLAAKWYGKDSYSLRWVNDSVQFSVATPGGDWGVQHAVIASAPVDQWVHVAGVFDGREIRLYLNGAPAASKRMADEGAPAVTLQDSNRPIRLGQGASLAVDELMLFDQALSVAQIRELASVSADVARALAQPAAAPPEIPAPVDPSVRPGGLIFVVDATGSMLICFDDLRRELSKLIEQVQAGQPFNIICFRAGDSIQTMSPAPTEINGESKKRANEFASSITPRGDTDPIPALEAAFAQHPERVVLLSDGDFENKSVILDHVRALEKARHVKIDTVGFIDPKRDGTEILRAIASETGGSYRAAPRDQ